MDPQLKAMADAQAMAQAALPPLDQIPPQMLRMGYRTTRQGQDQNAPRDVDTRELKVSGGAGEIPARLYTPPGAAAPGPGLVYFHGGGFVIGDLETHDGLCRRLAKQAGVRVLAVDYRLAPENPFPAAHDDALAASRWAFDHAEEVGFDRARIAVGGDSAGGNLAASVALDLRHDPERRIAFQLLLYPGIWLPEETASRRELDGPVLTRAAMAFFEKCLAADGHSQSTRAMLGDAEVSGAPPALVVTAGYDPLKDEGRLYAERLRAAGVTARHVEHPSLVHDFYILPDVSPLAVAAATQQTAEALRAALA